VDISEVNSVEVAAKVLLVEDDEGLAELIGEYLGRNGLEMHWIKRGDVAIEKTHELDPDLLLLDVMLPGMDGFEICRELRARGATLPIVILTARDEDFDRVVGLELGADDYLVKPFGMAELIARIRAVLRRAAPDPTPAEDAIVLGDVRLDPRTRTATHSEEPLDLPRREFDLLHMLMTNAGTVLPRQRLMDDVWGVDWFGSTKTLDVHVAGLRRRLGDDAQESRYIHTVRGVGFRFSSREELEG